MAESEWAKRMAQEFKAGKERKAEEDAKLQEEQAIRKDLLLNCGQTPGSFIDWRSVYAEEGFCKVWVRKSNLKQCQAGSEGETGNALPHRSDSRTRKVARVVARRLSKGMGGSPPLATAATKARSSSRWPLS
jgi:hypothetical protein